MWWNNLWCNEISSLQVDFFWINRDQRSFEWFVNLLSQLEMEQAELGVTMERFLEMHMYITSALQKNDMKAVGLQLAMDLLHEKVRKCLSVRNWHKQQKIWFTILTYWYCFSLIRRSEILSQVWKPERTRVVLIGIRCSSNSRIGRKGRLRSFIAVRRNLVEASDTNAISSDFASERNPFNICKRIKSLLIIISVRNEEYVNDSNLS